MTKDLIRIKGGLGFYVPMVNNPLKYVDYFGFCGISNDGWFDRFMDYYDEAVDDHANGLGLGVTDAIGVVGASSAATTLATSVLTAVAESGAEVQIVKGQLAGALEDGNILQKIAAAEEGEKLAARAIAGKACLNAVSKVSGIATAVASVWSFGVRTGFCVYAAIKATFN